MSTASDESSERPEPWLGLMTNSERHTLTADYYVLCKLGQGGFATVLLAEHRCTGILVAIKVLHKKRVRHELIISEVSILKALQHHSIVVLLDIIETEYEVFIVMQYEHGQNLERYLAKTELKRLPEHRVQGMFRELVEAVDFCHQKGIVHGDLKPENILLDGDGHPKLADFGLSFSFVEGQELTAPGCTLGFCAPEILWEEKYKGPPLDVWGLGIVLHEMVTGKNPFLETPEEYLEQTLKCKYNFPSYLSLDLRTLLLELLNPDPRMRPTIKEVLRYPWLQDAPFPSHRPEVLPKDTKLLILDTMDEMGYNPLKVVHALRNHQYNKEMATFLLLKGQALQGLDLTLTIKGKVIPSHIDPGPWVPSCSSRHSESAAKTSPLLPGVRPPAQQDDTGSLPLINFWMTPTPSASSQPVPVPTDTCQPVQKASSSTLHLAVASHSCSQARPASPGTSCRPTPEPARTAYQPSCRITATNRVRRGWKTIKRSIIGCLQALCCCPLPAPGRRSHRVAPGSGHNQEVPAVQC